MKYNVGDIVEYCNRYYIITGVNSERIDSFLLIKPGMRIHFNYIPGDMPKRLNCNKLIFLLLNENGKEDEFPWDIVKGIIKDELSKLP